MNHELERRRLREAEARFQTLVEDATWSTSKTYSGTSRTRITSPHVEEMLGTRPPSCARTARLRLQHHPPERARRGRCARRTRGPRRSAPAFSMEYRLIARDGRSGSATSACRSTTRTATGSSYQGIMIDVSDRHRRGGAPRQRGTLRRHAPVALGSATLMAGCARQRGPLRAAGYTKTSESGIEALSGR